MVIKVEREGRSAVTMKKLRWLLAFINASLGKRPVTAITAQDVLTMPRKMEGKGRYETAKRLRSTCSQISATPSPRRALSVTWQRTYAER